MRKVIGIGTPEVFQAQKVPDAPSSCETLFSTNFTVLKVQSVTSTWSIKYLLNLKYQLIFKLEVSLYCFQGLLTVQFCSDLGSSEEKPSPPALSSRVRTHGSQNTRLSLSAAYAYPMLFFNPRFLMNRARRIGVLP